MHRRAVRFGVLTLLLASAAAAAFLLRDADARVRALDERRRALDVTLERIVPAALDVAAAQKAYVDFGLRDEATLTRVGERLQEIGRDAVQLRSRDHSGDGTAHLEDLWASLAALTGAVTQAREQLAAGQPLTAADLLLGSAPQQHAAMLIAAVRGFRDAELQAVQTERDRVSRRSHVVLASVAALWFIGLVALARAPRGTLADPPTHAPDAGAGIARMVGRSAEVSASAGIARTAGRSAAASASAGAADVPATSAPEGPALREHSPVAAQPDDAALEGSDGRAPHEESSAAPGPQASRRPAIDLQSTAALCDAIARLSDTGSLPGILARAARLLDARGIIIWMGAGEELFAAAAFGYDAAVMERLRPIARTADNATAATWRTGQPRTVAAAGGSLGAIVAPMCGPADCLGVFAAEVRNAREADEDSRAVVAILAAQLAGVLAAWPPASSGRKELSTPNSQLPTSNFQ